MAYETLLLEHKDAIAHITLNRPDRLNSFDLRLGEELYGVLRQCARDPSVRAVILTGTGKGFCGGGDVKEMHAAADKSAFLRDLTKTIHRCVLEIRSMEKPVIAGVNGAAFGAGLSLALACDIVVAVKGAKLSTAFIGIGLAPGCGTQFFTRTVGYQKACEYILTAKTFPAEEGHALGLINTVVDPEHLSATLEQYAAEFRRLPPLAVGKAKMLINRSMENSLVDHLVLESETAAWSAASQDFAEGVTAFVEKRKAVFTGR